jgi:phosphoglycolate phosphatase-like HAD superfamily hydrolase
MRLLALDFDGVISDSAPEAFVVASRTFVALDPDTPLAEALAPFIEGPAPGVAQILAEPLYAAFVEHMPLGNRAEDYATVLFAIASSTPLPDQAAYDVFRDGLAEGFLQAYHRRFYKLRAALAEADPAGWHGLMAPYPGVVDLLRKRAGSVMLAIATSKDRHSVRALLRRYGIDRLFPEAQVLDKESGADKSAHLARLRSALGVDYPEITFVDDKVNHLDAVAPTGARCALATWGYNGPREIELARARSYLVCDLEHLDTQLFG